jgi:hypothetical protein
LERVFQADPKKCIDVVMWVVQDGGLFGHGHFLVPNRNGSSGPIACTDEEELDIMRQLYAEGGKRFGRGEPVPFSVFLEKYCYLGSAELSERRNKIIASLRREEESKMKEKGT